MAPTKVKTGSSKGSNRRDTKPSSSGSTSKNKAKSSVRHAAKQQRTAKPAVVPKQKKQRVYTEEELNIPTLNMITPAGVQKPKGKKKGKVFVDDPTSMMTIFSMVNAEKDGQIESKMMKARQMEEIRQAREAEMEAKANDKKSKLEETKKSLKRKRKPGNDSASSQPPSGQSAPKRKSEKKRVSFA